MDGLVLWPIALLERHAGKWPDTLWTTAIVCSTLAGPVYEILCHARWGQTFGKWVFGVCVLDVSEKPLRPWQALKRTAVPLILNLAWLVRQVLSGAREMTPADVPAPLVLISVAWFLLEVVTMLGSPKRRALHDHIAGTVVVRVIPMWRPAQVVVERT
jgi:uncharacterized RDD family membrane protein YckC